MHHQLLQQQEGFIKDKQQYLISEKYSFTSSPYTNFINPYTKKIKRKENRLQSYENLKFSPFINQTVRQQAVEEIIKKHRQNVIFNGFNNNQIGTNETNLAFDVNFAMSNLEIVTRVKNCQYDLYMRPDTNTNSHFQWFYFKIKINKKKRIKFTLKNFIKSTMLYNKGLKPFYLSMKEGNQKFVQITSDVQFYQDQKTEYFNLSFIFEFKYEMDEVQFCSQPPYGFQNLQKFLETVKNCRKYVLGKTVMRNKIPYLVFNQSLQSKIICVAIARQHPGESVGSWMMQGFLKQLNSGFYSKNIQWIVIPMVNIDGVQLGNNRTGILGHDFNRNWNIDENSKKQKMFPQIASILNFMRKLKRKYPKKVKLFLDFHGHSSEQNAFTYGPTHSEKTDAYYMSRLFPQLLAKKNDNFKLQQSSYVLLHEKKNAARSVMLNQFKIPFTYTIECTFGVMNNKQITQEEIIKLGEDIAISSNQFIQNIYLKNIPLSTNSLIQQIKQKYIDNLNQNDEYQTASQASSDNEKRQQFQSNIENLLESKVVSKRSSNSKLINSETLSQKLSLDRGRRGSEQPVIKSRPAELKPKRIATQGANPQVYGQCAYFPPINTRIRTQQSVLYNKISVGKQIVKQQTSGMMNMKQIQRRLFQLRNSRIGKKILIINAYGV